MVATDAIKRNRTIFFLVLFMLVLNLIISFIMIASLEQQQPEELFTIAQQLLIRSSPSPYPSLSPFRNFSLQSRSNVPTISPLPSDPEYCSLVDPVKTLHSKHTNHLPNGAIIDFYEMGETWGISLHFNQSIPQSQAKTQFRVETLLKSKIPNLKPRDDGSAPQYEYLLGCDDVKREPKGTAIVVVQNFVCPNIWHALCVQLGTMQLMRALGVKPDNVDYLMFNQRSIPFVAPWNASNLLFETVQPLFVSQKSNTSTIDLSNGACLERILWIETSRYRPGPLWELADNLRNPIDCKSKGLQRDMQSYQREYLNIVQPIIQNYRNDSDVRIQLCYMSRAKRVDAVRYFTRPVAAVFEGMLDQWVITHKDKIVLDRLLFDEDVQMIEQISRIAKCDVLFGPHGTGLAHQWFVDGKRRERQGKEPLLVIEWEHNRCPGYFRNMAGWLGHEYICFSPQTIIPSKNGFAAFPTQAFLLLLEEKIALKIRISSS